ncbi:MAG: dihydroorotase [Hyphomicrobiaceae bacterium]|nr:dihydroorotase [Hyphomicrobiaceae bacterium]
MTKPHLAKRKKKKIGSKPGDKIALINARLLDPESGLDEEGGLTIKKGKIAEMGPDLRRNAPDGFEVIDCGGHILCPGLIDMLVYTGEPGFEHRETLATASRAAAVGGVTTIICMPDTDPVIDDMALVDFVERRARDTAIVNVHPMAAATRGLEGKEMTEIGLLQEAGAVAFTNGASSVANARVMRRTLDYAKDFDALIVHSIEDPELAGSGVMNEGEVSSRLGMPGIPSSAEVIMLQRDMELAELTGARYHAAQISTASSLRVIRRAKGQGLRVSCGISVNHLTLNENDIGPYRTFLKVRPPLRREEDRLAMVEGLVSGDIDVIVSGHNPKDADVKRRPFAEAEDGAIGLETLLPAALRLFHGGDIELGPLLRAMTTKPADLLGLPAGRLRKGAPADLIVVDLETPWVVDPELLQSKSKNTPFDESQLQGRVLRTLVNGNTVYTLNDQD